MPLGQRFQPGNPGRPKGARNKFTDRFFGDILEAWEQHGVEALSRVAQEDPSTFVRVAAQLMSKDVSVTADVSESFARLWSAVSDGTVAKLADRMAGEPGQSASLRH